MTEIKLLIVHHRTYNAENDLRTEIHDGVIYPETLPDDLPIGVPDAAQHLTETKARELGFVLGANPRDAVHVDTPVIKRVGRALVNDPDSGETPNTVELKNCGLLLAVKSARLGEIVGYRGKQAQELLLDFGPFGGVLNGGNTYRICTMRRKDILERIKDVRNRVKIEILVNLPNNLMLEVATARNLTNKVQPISHDNKLGRFNWIKERLELYDWAPSVAYYEVDEKSPHTMKVTDVLRCACMMNILRFPNKKSEKQPVKMYSSKSAAITDHQSAPQRFQIALNILPQLIQLWELICFTGPDMVDPDRMHGTERKSKRNAEAVTVRIPIIKKVSSPVKFLSIGKESDRYLQAAAAYPLFSAFRNFVIVDSDGYLAWDRSFKEVKAFWYEHGPFLLRKTLSRVSKMFKNDMTTYGAVSDNWIDVHEKVRAKLLNGASKSIGKNHEHWEDMHQKVLIASKG